MNVDRYFYSSQNPSLDNMNFTSQTTNCGQRDAAVCLRSAAKSYTSKGLFKVFENVNLTVPTGKIYGLLGPSGCGKTTLIRCILNRVRLDVGTVRVFGHQPGTIESGVPGPTVGYMPQDTALYDTMTIGECFWYFGTMVGMSSVDIEAKIAYFQDLLKLPSTNKLTSQLSGGQGRRVSFAITLMHEPKLIILDEPTVGIDPILKDCVWKHLIHLSSKNTITIILTTHYIEEARSAHRIGLLHKGTLADEDDTESLISKYKCSTLEEVYLSICTGNYKSTDSDKMAKTFTDGNETSICFPSSFTDIEIHRSHKTCHKAQPKETSLWLMRECRIRRNQLKSIIFKNLLFLYRFPGAVLVMLLIPSITMFLTNFTFASTIGPVTISVVNDDNGHLGSGYLSFLSPSIMHLATSDSLVTAKQDVVHHRTYGMIHVHANFTTRLNERYVTRRHV